MDEPVNPLLVRLSAFLAERLGLHFTPERQGGRKIAIGSEAREIGYADGDE